VEQDTLEQQIGRVQSCGDGEQLNEALLTLCQANEFEYYQYCLMIPVGLLQSQVMLLTHSPDNWAETYWEKQYMIHDPVVRLTLSQQKPIRWHELDAADAGLSDGERAVMQARHEFGMNEGITFPLHNPQGFHAMLSFSRSRVKPLSLSQIGHLGLVSQHLFDHSIQILSAPIPKLTDRERECLFWVSEGKTSWEVAQILGITERTVNFHLNSASRKSGCKNRYQTIARNMATGQLMPALGRLTLAQFIPV